MSEWVAIAFLGGSEESSSTGGSKAGALVGVLVGVLVGARLRVSVGVPGTTASRITAPSVGMSSKRFPHGAWMSA